MTAEIFSSPERYQEQFRSGLDHLLRNDSLGAFVLVLANATYDDTLYELLSPHLHQRFEQNAEALTRDLREGCRMNHAEDDLVVFLKLMALGLDNLKKTRFRSEGPWQLQYNQLRAFRPSRMSKMVVTELHAPFDEHGFHFNKPYLRDEMIWEGELLGHHSRLYYNKFPFAPLHALLIMDPERNCPQYLDQATHEQAWRLLEQIGARLPGTGLGYNSRGAYSSINHLHLQMYSGKRDGYPIEDPRWTHNGGEEAWPLAVEHRQDMHAAWRFIEELHREGQAYNLLYRPGSVYITPRAMQGSYRHSDWTGGFAWAEVAGAITTFCETEFAKLDADTIDGEMGKLRP